MGALSFDSSSGLAFRCRLADGRMDEGVRIPYSSREDLDVVFARREDGLHEGSADTAGASCYSNCDHVVV